MLQLGLTPLVAAAALERLALLLQPGELPARVLDAVVHAEALGSPLQGAAEDEQPLVAAGIVHGRLGALVDAILLGNLLIEVRELGRVRAAAPGRGELLLELHAADILLALGHGRAR